MDIETKCTGCGEKLKVSAEFAGRSARCPVCSTIYVVPESPVPASVEPVASEPSSPVPVPAVAAPPPVVDWFLKTPEGPIYGPVSRLELDRWVDEGRVTHDCDLRPETHSDWQSAATVFPILRPATASELTAMHAPSPGTNVYQLPNRGPLILILGIMGLVVWCPILSIMAWVMGTNDLREIRAGMRDPLGQPLTQAGQMLGLVLSMVWIVAALITAGVIVFIAAMS